MKDLNRKKGVEKVLNVLKCVETGFGFQTHSTQFKR